MGKETAAKTGGESGPGLKLFFVACAVAVAAIVVIAVLVSGPSEEASAPGPSQGPTAVPTPRKKICDNQSPALLDMKQLRSEPFPMSIDRNASYKALVTTSCGTMEIKLDAKEAPVAVNNFIHLAKGAFYLGQVFFKIDAGLGFIQTGDPSCPVDVAGCGTNGPGYTIPDELHNGLKSKEGIVAMVDPAGPDSAGSQFLIRVGGKGAPPPGEGTIFGQLVGRHSLQVAQLIMSMPTKVAPGATLPAPEDFPNGEWVYITKIEIVQGKG